MHRTTLAGAALLGILGTASPGPAAPPAHPVAELNMSVNEPAVLTHALFEPLQPQWVVAGEPLPSASALNRLAQIPKPVHCRAQRADGVLRVECVPVDAAGAPARRGAALIGRLVGQLGGDAPVLVVGRGFSLRMTASDLGRWAEQYVLEPRPDLAWRDPRPDEAASGLRAVVTMEVALDLPISGVELGRAP